MVSSKILESATNETLNNHGFKHSMLHTHRIKDLLVLIIYVDDLLRVGKSLEDIMKVNFALTSEFEISDCGYLKFSEPLTRLLREERSCASNKIKTATCFVDADWLGDPRK